MGRHLLTPVAVPIPTFRLLLVSVSALLFAFLLGNSHGVAALSIPIPVVAAPEPAPYDADHDEEYRVNSVEEESSKLGEEELTRLKQRILEGLGLTRVPDVSKMNVSQEEYERMYGVYLRSVEENRRRRHREQQREMELEELDGVTAQRFYSFTHTGYLKGRARREAGSRQRQSAITWLYFPLDIPEVGRGQQVRIDYATLRLFVSGLHPEEAARGDNTVEVRVYQVLQPDQKVHVDYNGKSRAPKEGRMLVDQRRIHLATSASKWTEFDVTKAAESWVNGGASNLGLELECRECVRRGITLVTQDTEGSNSSVSPVLNVHADVQVKGNPRQKRNSDPLHSERQSRRTECRKDKDGQRCCRHKMEVVFRDLEEFGFIIEPKHFDAGYCKGRCPPRYNPANRHALLQSLIRRQNRDRAPRLCCAPNKLTDLEVLHADEHDSTKLKVTSWKNISVEECACS